MDPIVEATIAGSYIIGSYGLVSVVIGVFLKGFLSHWLAKRRIIWHEERKERKELHDRIHGQPFSNVG